MYTIRQCIKELRRTSRNVVTLNNCTKIVLLELGMQPSEQPFSKLKGDDNTMRRILCRIEDNDKTVMLDELRRAGRCLYSAKEEEEFGCSYFGKQDFILPERVMNEFISANGGIDHYLTIAAWGYLLSDMMED